MICFLRQMTVGWLLHHSDNQSEGLMMSEGALYDIANQTALCPAQMHLAARLHRACMQPRSKLTEHIHLHSVAAQVNPLRTTRWGVWSVWGVGGIPERAQGCRAPERPGHILSQLSVSPALSHSLPAWILPAETCTDLVTEQLRHAGIAGAVNGCTTRL